MAATAKIEGTGNNRVLVITVPISPKATVSDKGNRVIASTSGFRDFDTQYNGKDVKINVVAMVAE